MKKTEAARSGHARFASPVMKRPTTLLRYARWCRQGWRRFPPGLPAGVLLICALLAGCAASGTRPGDSTTPAQWQAEQIAALDQAQRIYDRAQRQPGLLAQDEFMRHAGHQHAGAAFTVIFGQYQNWYDGFMGSYLRAQRKFSIAQPLPPSAAASPLVRSGTWRAVPALVAIPRLARGYRAVFLNEDHTNPETRSLTVALLSRLRRDGFNTFAAETLYAQGIAGLRRRGHATDGSGFYTREPVYAEMVRTALRLGYRVIAYEAAAGAHAGTREAGQAANLDRRAFAGHPDARLVVNAGFAHIEKHGRYLGGHSMAEDFMRRTGIDPLVIEQTMLTGHLRRSYDSPYWRAVIDALHPRQPIVFLDARGRPWSLLPRRYDVSVFFPRERVADGRPTWLGLWGLRVPKTVPAGLCRGHYPCLLEARPPGEPRKAVPADRTLLRCAAEQRALWLRPGAYALIAVDEADQVVGRITLQARADTPLPRGTPATDDRAMACHPLMQVLSFRR